MDVGSKWCAHRRIVCSACFHQMTASKQEWWWWKTWTFSGEERWLSAMFTQQEHAHQTYIIVIHIAPIVYLLSVQWWIQTLYWTGLMHVKYCIPVAVKMKIKISEHTNTTLHCILQRLPWCWYMLCLEAVLFILCCSDLIYTSLLFAFCCVFCFQSCFEFSIAWNLWIFALCTPYWRYFSDSALYKFIGKSSRNHFGYIFARCSMFCVSIHAGVLLLN